MRTPGPIQAERRRSATGLTSMQAPRSAPLVRLRSSAAPSASALATRLPRAESLIMVPRQMSRGERLSTALQRGFVSSRVLNIRAGPAALSDLAGPMAPERYIALPHRSIVAARAMVCVTLAKGNRDVSRLETFRRSGSLRITDRARSTGPDALMPRKWFDEVADALLGNPLGPSLESAVHTLKALELGPNKSHSTLRRAQMPAEAFRLDATGGVDYVDVTAPARETDLPDLCLASLTAKPVLNAASFDALQAVDSPQRPVPEDVLFPDLDAEEKPLEVNIPVEAKEKPDRPLMDMEIDSVVKDLEQTQTQPLGEIDVVMVSPLKQTHIDPNLIALSPQPSPLKSDTLQPDLGKAMDGVWATHALTGSKGTQALLSLVGRTQQGKVSVGVEIAFQDSPKTHVAEGNASVTAAEVVQINDLPSIDLRTETPDPEAGYSVRRDGPTGMLNELLQELHTGELTPNRVHSRKSRTEVVVVDGDNGPDGEIEAIPSSSKRPRKRRSVSFARSDRKQMEERKAKFVSTVVQTMQEDPAIVKKRQLRAALSPMNGHRTTSRKSEDREARRSTRRRKSVSLVESSDEDASPNDKSEDVPIDIDEDDDGLGITPDSPDPSPGTRMQVDIQAPLRRMSRKARSANTLDSPQPLIRTGTQRTKALDVSGAEPVSKKLRSSTKGNFVSLWDKRLERLEDAIAANETGSPSLSDVEADIEETMLFEIIPTLEKIMDAVRDGEMGLLECDQYSQQNAVIQAYKNTKDDAPYAPTAKSPGTQFYLDVWKDRRARKERKLSVPKIDDGGAQGFATNTPNGGTFANGGTSGEDRSPTASQHTGENSVRSDSSGGKVGEDDAQKAARLEREEASERARELQSRVCGKLLESMSAEAKVRVLRWAEADCSWFDDGTDMMEIVASRVVKTCAQCDERDGNYNEKCEESILLKLWANMTWRKIRRMRHRDRGASN